MAWPTSHYLNQWWLVYWRIYTSLGLNELIKQYQIILETIIGPVGRAYRASSSLIIFTNSCTDTAGRKKSHDDIIKWKHFPRNWPFVRGIHRSPVNSPHKGQCRGALMFSLICVWINDWVNNREAGDLRRYLAHSDVIVMYLHRRQRPVADCC